MMPVNEVVTIFAYDREKADFVRKGTFSAWVRRMQRLRNTSRGTYYCDNFDVRISTDVLDLVNAGDLIFFGTLTEDEFAVEKCRKIAVVSCNRFGVNPHWHLEAEYEYR